MKYLRHITTVLLVITILAAPDWLYLPALITATVFFPFYWEGMIGGFLIEILYGLSGQRFNFVPVYALSILFILAIVPFIKERIRLNA